MAKSKTVKARVGKVKQARRISKDVAFPWLVYSVVPNGQHVLERECEMKKDAERYVKQNLHLLAPYLVHVEIPPTEY